MTDARTEEEVIEAAVGEVRVDEHLVPGGGPGAASEEGDEVAVLHLEQQVDLSGSGSFPSRAGVHRERDLGRN